MQEHCQRRVLSSGNLEQSDIIWQPPSQTLVKLLHTFCKKKGTSGFTSNTLLIKKLSLPILICSHIFAVAMYCHRLDICSMSIFDINLKLRSTEY